MAKNDPQTQAVSPPSGIGAVPGLGEAFQVNLNTGQGVYSYRLPLPPGVADHTPKLALEYRHGARADAFGFGWMLPMRTIDRRLDLGTADDHAHETFLDGGSELVQLHDGAYGPLKETAFTRYSRSGDGWLVEERDGTVHTLGTSPASRVADPDHADRVVQWLIERTVDSFGNAVSYAWQIIDGFAYIAEIRYAAYAVRFTYAMRPDVRRDGRAGFLRKLGQRCTAVSLFLDPGAGERRLRAWSLAYNDVEQHSLLASITLTSFGAGGDPAQDIVRAPVRFEYGSFDPLRYKARYLASTGSRPPALGSDNIAMLALDQVPLPGVLQAANGRQYYWRNNGRGALEGPRKLAETPFAGSFASAEVAFIDLDGSGSPDLMVAGKGLPGYYENDGANGWGRFVGYPRANREMPVWSSPRVRLTDADADGRIDAILAADHYFALWRNLGKSGWSQPILAPKLATEDAPDVDFNDPLVFLADMTGDGLQDVVRVNSGSVEYWPSLGNGRFGARVRMTNSPRLRDLFVDPRQILLADVDGDGCADLIRVSTYAIELYRNRHGAAFADAVVLDTIPAVIPGSARISSGESPLATGLTWNSYRGRDINYVELQFNQPEPPYVLTRIDNGAGLNSVLSYRSATEDFLLDREEGPRWETNFPFPFLVVGGSKETDNVSGQFTEVRYRYHESHYEASTRQFQGFRSADRIEVGDESRPDTRTSFHFLMAMERAPGNGPEYATLNGMLTRTEIYGLDGLATETLPYRVELATHALTVLEDAADGRPRAFVRVASHRVEDSERTTDLRVEEKTYTYDAFGNVTREVHRGSGSLSGVAQPELVRTTDVTYATSATQRILGKPAAVVVRDDTGRINSETRTYYDGANFIGLPLGQMTHGAVARESRLVLPAVDFNALYAGMDANSLGFRSENDADGIASLFIDAKRRAHDARGLLTGDCDPLGTTTSYGYDGDGLFRVLLTDTLGVTTFVYDRAAGQPLQATYADGSVMRFTYDTQGRLLFTLAPGDDPAHPPRVHAYEDSVIPNSRTTTMLQSTIGAATSEVVTYFNGRGEEIQDRVQMSATAYVVSGKRLFNPWGDVKQEFEPAFSTNRAFSLPASAGLPSRTMGYDARGRVIRALNYTAGVSTADFQPFSITTFDANDNDHSAENIARGQADTPHREVFDVFRQRVGVTEVLGGGAELTLTYVPDVGGRILEAHDSLGPLFSCKYDCLGNRYETVHRAAGRRRVWHDARGKVVRSVDAKGNDLSVELDARGRIQRLRDGANVIEEYTYDVLAQNASGKLARVTYPAGSQVFRYDSGGKLTRHEVAFTGVADVRTIGFEYDPLGRETAVVHSDGTRVEKTLALNGWVTAITGVLTGVVYDPRGVPSQISYANGVKTDIAYVPGPARVSTQRTVGPLNQVFENVGYSYDAMGLLLSSDDTAPAARGLASHALDPLYQLKASTFASEDGPVTLGYEYFNHVNLARLDESDSVFTYGDAAHPDWITGITVGATAEVAIAYDANGNLLNLPGKTFTYNSKNELSSFTGADGLHATYAYDHHGLRVAKTTDDGHGHVSATQFIGLDIEINGGVPAYFVRLGERRVAVLRQGDIDFIHCDYAGSTSFFTSTVGAKIAAIAYRPFGNVAASNGTVSTRTFGSHPFDAESGLYYMRRRYYAPEIGRFLTPDPLVLHQPQKLIGNPKALYPYIYVGNDPLDNIDYDGLSFWSVVGAIVGVVLVVAIVVVTAGLAAVVGVAAALVIGGLMTIGLVTIGYLGANSNRGSGLGDFWRGFMIGLNAGLNAVIGTMVFGPVIGVALGVINFLAAFDGIAGNRIYQGILGYSSWLMPMSWIVNALGLIFFVINIIVAGVTFQQWDAAKIDNIHVNWETGSIIISGGLIRPAGSASGFDMGNFVFLKPGSTAEGHETGHTLNLAAYGWIFHFIGALDENVTGGGADAFAEHLADSHDPSLANPSQWWDIWDPNHA
jgi:RHS repeat-associated protein